MTFEKKFSEFKEKFTNPDTKKITEDFAIQVEMTDEDCGGIFYIASIDGAFSIEPYDYVDNTARIAGLSTNLKRIFTGKMGIEKAVTDGKIEIHGNIDNIKLLPNLIRKPAVPKKTACKRTCGAKKTESKTTAKKTVAKKAPAKKTSK